jgi:predicted GIY-YIG superfamily endonuclease
MTEHALYRFYGINDELLYIGITANIGSRLKQHSKAKPWWTDVHHITLEHYEDRAKVLAAETAAIIAERPRHNIVYNRNRPATPPALKPQPISIVDDMTPEQFAGYMMDRHPRVHGPWPKPQLKPCLLCGDALVPPTNVVRSNGDMHIAHRACRDQWYLDHPADEPDTIKKFRDERRDAILRGEIL